MALARRAGRISPVVCWPLRRHGALEGSSGRPAWELGGVDQASRLDFRKWGGHGQLPDTWFHGRVSKPCLFIAMLSGHVCGALPGTQRHPTCRHTHTHTHKEVKSQHLAMHSLSPKTECHAAQP